MGMTAYIKNMEKSQINGIIQLKFLENNSNPNQN
jgi:hypothetical protein